MGKGKEGRSHSTRDHTNDTQMEGREKGWGNELRVRHIDTQVAMPMPQVYEHLSSIQSCFRCKIRVSVNVTR